MTPSSSAILIRLAEPHDMPAIAAIYAPYVRDTLITFELEPPTADEMYGRRNALITASYPYLVAERGGRIAGYAYATSFRTRAAYRFTVENSIYLSSDCQHQGIGALLLQALIEACAAQGFKQMVAVIADPENNPGSVHLHEKCGFTNVGSLKAVGYKFGRWVDTLMLQRALGTFS